MGKLTSYVEHPKDRVKKAGNAPLEAALQSFQDRLGVSYENLVTSKAAQVRAREVLDEETQALREKHGL